ncbi:MAG: metallophosphoesterase [Actinobacteria bacterium]|nr:metallophosphoesterase [Actinomycetota bacterium]
MRAVTIPGMSIYVVADLHGSPEALAKAVPEGAPLLLLGDLINFLDYTTMTGILTEVFSVAAVTEVARLRTEGKVLEARDIMRRRSEGREGEVRDEIRRRVHEQYQRVFDALPDPTYFVLGNVDQPALVTSFAESTPAATHVDAQTLTLEGETFGFVGGALPTPLGVAGEITEDEMRAKIDAIGEVDVVCSHVPPAVPELCFDTLAGKRERGSTDLLAYIEDVQPRRAYFGHVHQPLVSSLRIGRTLCVNVGYFRATRSAWPHQPASHTEV